MVITVPFLALQIVRRRVITRMDRALVRKGWMGPFCNEGKIDVNSLLQT